MLVQGEIDAVSFDRDLLHAKAQTLFETGFARQPDTSRRRR